MISSATELDTIQVQRGALTSIAEKAGAKSAHVEVVDVVTGETFPDGPPPGEPRDRYRVSLDRYREASEEGEWPPRPGV